MKRRDAFQVTVALVALALVATRVLDPAQWKRSEVVLHVDG